MCWNISSGWIKSGSETGFLSDGEKRRACMLQSIQARFQFGSALQDRVVQLIFRKAGQLGDLLDGVLGREPFVHPRADERERAFKRTALLRRLLRAGHDEHELAPGRILRVIGRGLAQRRAPDLLVELRQLPPRSCSRLPSTSASATFFRALS